MAFNPWNNADYLEDAINSGGGGGGSGPAVPGLDGESGEDGLPGPPGPPGATGPPGSGDTGATGPVGPALFLAAEDGEEGQPGPPGRQGVDGIQGAQGDPGNTGATGPVGPALFLVAEDGAEGEPGPPGRQGVDGAPGSNGSTGATGPVGPAIFLVADAPEEPIPMPGPQGPSGAAGAGDLTLISGNSGAAGAKQTHQILTGNAASNSTTSYVAVMTTTGLATGWYAFRYFIVTQSAATTTGQKFRVNFSGTAGNAGALMIWGSTGTTATTDVLAAGADATSNRTVQFNTAVASATDLGPMTDVQALNADAFLIIDGYLEVTTTGNLSLDHASEAAAASTVQAGTWLQLTKIG